MYKLILGALIGLALLLTHSTVLAADNKEPTWETLIKVYQINKKVSDFPEAEDFSTPESAYATINRLSATGDQSFWPRVSVNRAASRMDPNAAPVQLSSDVVKGRLEANIVEVRLFDSRLAMVIAEESANGKTVFDMRSFELEDSQWKNAGNDVSGDLDEARARFDIRCSRLIQRPTRSGIDNPEAYLKTFTDFLTENGSDPHTFVMDALKDHKLLIIGEVHHRPIYWAFNSSLASDPEFGDHVGAIYLELPANQQETVDAFLAEPTCRKDLIIKILRDMMWMGWPDQPMLEFFEAVWYANAQLPEEKKLRIVLADMHRPWDKLETRKDFRQYRVDRDEFMAEQVIKDIESHPDDDRAGLFIVGVGHTAKDFKFFGNHPHKTAGWHLTQKFGKENVYAIMQHRCVMTNNGQVSGRVGLGLFDSAFSAQNNKPVAFTLEQGPFGEQPYQAQPDTPVFSKYRDGFNAYLYLGPLEDEIFSPLIPGFYTDEHVKELDRRHKMLFGQGWVEAYNMPEPNAESFIDWMSGEYGGWGRPRDWTRKLGPIDAWVYGDNWEHKIQLAKHRDALEHPDELIQAAEKLFNAIRDADYDSFVGGKNWNHFPSDEVDYQVGRNYPGWVAWSCKTFANNSIQDVQIGEVLWSDKGLPAVRYSITLNDGKVLTGELPFRYNARLNGWTGIEGIDWHLQPPPPE